MKDTEEAYAFGNLAKLALTREFPDYFENAWMRAMSEKDPAKDPENPVAAAIEVYKGDFFLRIAKFFTFLFVTEIVILLLTPAPDSNVAIAIMAGISIFTTGVTGGIAILCFFRSTSLCSKNHVAQPFINALNLLGEEGYGEEACYTWGDDYCRKRAERKLTVVARLVLNHELTMETLKRMFDTFKCLGLTGKKEYQSFFDRAKAENTVKTHQL